MLDYKTFLSEQVESIALAVGGQAPGWTPTDHPPPNTPGILNNPRVLHGIPGYTDPAETWSVDWWRWGHRWLGAW